MRRPREGLEHFNIGSDRMPKGVYHAYGYVKEVVTIEPQIEDLMALFYERIGQLTAGHGLGKNYWRGCR